MKITKLSFWTIAVMLFFASTALGQTTVNSDIISNTTWSGTVTVAEPITVAEGVTLTIEPGIVVEMASGVSINVEGALVADGTSADNILFTSAATTPAAGDWGTIRFNNTGDVGSVFDYVILEYGGSGAGGSLVSYTTGAFGFDITNSEFRFSNAHGIDLRASSPLIQNSTFRDNAGFGIFSDLALNYQVETSTIIRNTQGGVRVPINATPTITQSVIDTNGTGILIDNGAIPEITDNDIRANDTGIRVVETGSTTPTISDNTISGNTTIGVLNSGMGLLVADYNFWGDKSGPQNASNPNGTGDEVSNNVDFSPWLFGATLPVREVTSNPQNGDIWYADSVYYVKQNIALSQLSTLTIQPGAVVKFADDVTFNVYGTLIADGTEADRIYFTSHYDDAIGGDSNGDARTTQPQPGDWRRLIIEEESANVVLDYVDLRYGGYSYGMLYLDNNTASISNLVAIYSDRHGIHLNVKPAAFNNVVANNNNIDGIVLYNQGSEFNNITASYNGGSGVNIRLNTLTENVSIKNSEFSGNEGQGIRFYSGGADRSFGLDSLTNTTITNNAQNGLLVEQNGVDELYIYNNTFEGNGQYGASIYLNDAFGDANHIEENIFRNNGNAGLKTTSARIFNNQFEGNEFGLTLWGQLGHIYTDGSGIDGNTFVDNTFNNVLGLQGFHLKGTLTTTFPEGITSGAYMFQRVYEYGTGSAAVAENDTLTIEPGAIIKSGYSGYGANHFGTSDGMLVAEGTAGDPIVFTSWRDDVWGGDTDAPDDTVSAKPDDWGGLFIQDRSNDNNGLAKFSRVSHLVIRYADTGIDMQMGRQAFADELDNLTILHSDNDGFDLNYGKYTITNALVDGTEHGQGIRSYYEADVTVRNSIVRNSNQNGLYAYGDQSSFYREVSNSTIEGNGYDGIYTEGLQFSSTVLGNTIQNNERNGIVYYHTTLDSTDIYFTGNIIKNNLNSGILSSAAVFIDNEFEGNEFGITLHGKLGHRYTDENGDDGNTFVGNTFNNVLGLQGYHLKGILSTTFPEGITSGAYMFQRVYEYGTGSAAVALNDTLVIESGIIIKSGYSGYSANHFGASDGMLVAEGTAGDPIVFTSWRDDVWGGDTDAPDDTVSAKPDDWGGLFIQDRSNDNNGLAKFSRVSHLVIRYADTGIDMQMGRQAFADELDNLTILHSDNDGFGLNYGKYTITNALVDGTEHGQGIRSYYEADVTVRNSTIRNSNQNGLYSYGYYNSFFREVSNSTIEGNGEDGINSLDSPSPMTFQFNRIENNERHGIWSTVKEATTDTVLTISGNNIRNNIGAGILSSRAVIVDDTLEFNQVPIALTGELSKSGTINEDGNYYDGNQIANNELQDAIGIYSSVEGKLGYTYPSSFANTAHVPISDLEVGAEDTLMIAPGTVFKSGFEGGGDELRVEGYLNATGTVDNKIVFTSIYDDTYAGDTNLDGIETVPARSDWYRILVGGEGSVGTQFKHVIARYANRNFHFHDNAEVVIDSSYTSNANYGIHSTGGAKPTIRNSDIHHNRYGFDISGSSDDPNIHLNNFYDNDDAGLYVSRDVTAIDNYWGDATGPFVDQGSDLNVEGNGDRIYINGSHTVDYRPFRTDRTGILLGDVSEEGTISAFDGSLILQDVVDLIELTSTQQAAADVSGDGTVAAMDASYVLQYVVGSISGFPGAGKVPSLELNELYEIEPIAKNSYYDLIIKSKGKVPFYASEMTIDYDEAMISDVEIMNTPQTDKWSRVMNVENGIAKVAFAGVEPVKKEGEFMHLRFFFTEENSNGFVGDMQISSFRINNIALEESVGEQLTSLNEQFQMPESFSLDQNYPNPFNPSTNIQYQLPVTGEVTVEIFNIIGQQVAVLVNNKLQQAGRYSLSWDASRQASGMYFYRIHIAGKNGKKFTQVRKMTLIK